ncbi:hypothetical protein MNBD_CHLOROFLEXI01-3595 [hydrothermal vent metagenome]|uniref:DUF2249 domain-containing protein n=1 Tax=hydrothermal vent metagenome TaxID=652676 RepID=A0A3B0VMQ6_9ZZZZ
MIKVKPSSKLSKALRLHPDVLDYVVSLNPHDFERLYNPLMRKLLPQRISLARLAQMTDTPLAELLITIHHKAQLPLETADLQEIERLAAVASTTPLPKNLTAPPDWLDGHVSKVVDLLESDDRLDTDPFVPLFPVINHAKEGDVILLKHRWEPQPLYDVWQKLNIQHFATKVADDEWWIYIRKGKKYARSRHRSK